MDFFMQELGVPGSQLVLAAEQTLYMVFLSLFIGTVLGLIIAVTLVACDKRPYTILKMHFLGNNTTDNVLYHINKTFDLETSVLFATVTELEHTVLGIFIVQFIGDDFEVGKVKEYLVAQGIEWQEVTL